MYKKMIYSSKPKLEIIAENTYKNYKYYVFNLGTHPTAYVEIPKTHKYYGVFYDDIDIDVHGGLTYSNYHLPQQKNIDSYFIGWDYAYYGDYICMPIKLKIKYDSNDKKWTTEEIIEDCKKVIEQLIEV